MISKDLMVESIRYVMSLDLHGKEKLCDDIFHNQPNLLGTVLALSKLDVPMVKIEEVLFILLVLYTVFYKKSSFVIPVISKDFIKKAHKNNTAMLQYLDKEGMNAGMELIGKSMQSHSEKFVIAFMIGHLNEHGFGNYSKENEYCVRAAKVIMDCFIETGETSRVKS